MHRPSRRRSRRRASRKAVAIAAAIVCTASLAACSGDGDGKPELIWYTNPDAGGQAAVAEACSHRRLHHLGPGPAPGLQPAAHPARPPSRRG